MDFSTTEMEDFLELVKLNKVSEIEDNLFLIGRKKIDLNCKGLYGVTPLMMASHMGYKKLIELFLKCGADINIQDDYGNTALHLSCVHEKNEEIVKLLLQHNPDLNIQDKNGSTPLMLACSDTLSLRQIYWKEDNYIKIVELLLKAGADPNIRNNNGKSALLIAVEQIRRYHIIELLIMNGADVNAKDNDGKTALMRTNIYAEDDVIECLIKFGANLSLMDYTGNNVLYYYVFSPTKLHKLLLHIRLQNVDLNSKNNEGTTILMKACAHYVDEHDEIYYEYFEEVLDLLKKFGFLDINVQDNNGKTALMIAIENNRYGTGKYICESLIKYGADINVKDKEGKTAVDIARTMNDDELTELLLEVI